MSEKHLEPETGAVVFFILGTLTVMCASNGTTTASFVAAKMRSSSRHACFFTHGVSVVAREIIYAIEA